MAQEAAAHVEAHPPALDPIVPPARAPPPRQEDGWKWHCLRAASPEPLPPLPS